ncbi:MAG TPA: hypothetical protein VKZ95_03715 [Sphingobacteriaceae bacterium]|nr:hypothetical protein [Sphingobacteriaceae bacterium]
MEWEQIFTLAGINIALIGLVASLVIWSVNRIDSDVKSIKDDVNSLGSMMDSHALRIDQLYRMFVDLLKERQ